MTKRPSTENILTSMCSFLSLTLPYLSEIIVRNVSCFPDEGPTVTEAELSQLHLYVQKNLPCWDGMMTPVENMLKYMCNML